MNINDLDQFFIISVNGLVFVIIEENIMMQ